jgi:F-type H+-transporting ATPase subunit b
VLIDWFTVLAQIVNFLILVALLKRYLYGPLVAAIDAREKSIAACLADAARKESEAALRVEQLTEEAAETQRRKAEVLAAAREDADRQRAAILTEARNNAKSLEAKWRDALEREKAAFLDEVRRRAAAEILSATRVALRNLACADVERCAMSAFLEKVPSLDPELLRAFAAEGMTVVTRDDLPAELRQAVRCAIENRLGGPVEIAFERVPALAWGVELRGNGRRIGWTPDAWLDSIEDKLRVSLDSASATKYDVVANELVSETA